MIRWCLVAALAGCSYTRPADVGPGMDGNTPSDGNVQDGTPADAHSCNAQITYLKMTLPQTDQAAFGVRSVTPILDEWQGVLDTGGVTLILQLVSGSPPFTAAIQPGSYPVPTTIQADYGLVALMGFEPDGQGLFLDWYIANGGSIAIQVVPDATGGGQMAGQFNNVSFVRVQTTATHQPTSTPDPSCTSMVKNLSFNAPSMPQ